MDAASVCDFQPASFWVLQFTLPFGFSPYPGIAGLLYTKVYWELAFCSYQTGEQLQAGPAAPVAASSRLLPRFLPRRCSRYPLDEAGFSCHELECGQLKPCPRFGPVSYKAGVFPVSRKSCQTAGRRQRKPSGWLVAHLGRVCLVLCI